MPEQLDIETLIHTHLDDLYSLAYRLSGSKEIAEDLVQDLFVNISTSNADATQVRNPKAWLSSILYRRFVDHWRREKRSPVKLFDQHYTDTQDPMENVSCELPGPLHLLEQDDLKKFVAEALDTLSAAYKEIIILHDIEGYSIQELKIIMNLPVGTLKSRLHRARDKLHSKLKPLTNEVNETIEKQTAVQGKI